MLTGVVVFLLLLTALLAIPITLTYRVTWPGIIRNETHLQWAFGLVRVRLPADAPSLEDNRAKQKIGDSARSSANARNILAAIRQDRFRHRIIRFLGDVWRAVHKKNVSLRLRVGLGDPADTGQLWAVFGPLAGMLTNIRDASVRIEPEFFDSALELDSSGSIRLVPLQILYLGLALLLSPSIWQGIRQLRGATK